MSASATVSLFIAAPGISSHDKMSGAPLSSRDPLGRTIGDPEGRGYRNNR
jgi:hypothetical protein